MPTRPRRGLWAVLAVALCAALVAITWVVTSDGDSERSTSTSRPPPGTARSDGRLVAAGGRVLNVSARGRTLAEARQRAYEAVGKIDWPGGFCRSDIGWRALQR